LRLSCDGTKADLNRLGIVRQHGLEPLFSDVGLDCYSTVEWSQELVDWVVVSLT